ncbi:unnamed protein product [Ectocarpus sp. CCAP 1310/34]|nr:unnamed protein product [Ectocarpus sp. CCAP 1310/34]
MNNTDCTESSSVPRLLSLLVASVEEASQACSSSWEGEYNPPENTWSARTTCSSSLRIRGLRRAYNILLFGGPSHAEILAQAALEDSNHYCCDNFDAGPSVAAAVSVVSLELRRARRYDPANALEGLVEDLIASNGCKERQREDTDGCSSAVENVLRLLLALRGEGRRASDVDDWELLGGHSRRVLERLYSSSSSSSSSSIGEAVGLDICTSDAAAGCRAEGLGKADEPALATKAASLGVRQQQHRYLLPVDCVLHGDSTATPAATTLSSTVLSFSDTAKHGVVGAIERIPWFTDAEFSSERGIPNMNKGPSLDEGLEFMATAPLSPANWTRLRESSATAGDDTVVAHGSRGAPVAPVMVVGHGEGIGVRRSNLSMPAVAASQVNGGASLVHGGLDLCGALSQANIDARSPAVRELRLALSFPDLDESLPTDLLEAAKLYEPPGRPTDHPVGDGYQHGLPERTFGEANVLWQSPRGVLRSPKGKCGRMLPMDEFAPPWASNNGGHLSGVIHDAANHEVAALELEPVGWERTEADWNDPSFPKWALACAPLATGEGGGPSSKKAFELCYREHFGWAGLGGSLGEADSTAKAEVEVVRRALAALQGVPSGYFWYDETRAQMCVCGNVGQDGAVEEAPSMPPRVAGLSPGALSSLLEEFAMAGTWYRRVQELVRCLVNASSSNGQVSRAFGIELRRQLTEVESALLVVTMELEGLEWNESDSACLHGTQDTPLNEQRFCSLAGILAYTTQLRRAVGALAEICGLSEDDLRSAGGVRAVFNAFPRGASLLTYLYKAAEVRVASKPGGESTCFFGRVMAEGDSALALLSSAATPYLSMLGRWLWSGEMWAEDDPCEEFPLRCREGLTGNDTSKATKEPWTEDGGGSFMSLAFCENGAAGVPCFLAGGVLHAAARAGKLLRMLKLSSPEFYTACSASPPPPLSLEFGSRALASRVAIFERLRLLRAAAGQSAAREIRARVAEKEMKTGMTRGGGSEQLVAEERSALGKLQLQRERDYASVKEARRIWVQGLEGDRAAAAAAAAVAAANVTAAATAAEKPSPAGVYGGQGVLSFLDPPTSEAEAFAAAAITERYRVLGEEADARAARARWKRQRSARVVAARASLKMLYEEEMHLWEGMAAGAGPGAESHSTTAGHEAGVSDVDNADNTLQDVVDSSSADAVGGGPDSTDGTGGGQMGHVVEQAVAEGELIADSDGSRVEVRAEEEVGTSKRGRDSEGSEAPDKRPGGDDANISPVGMLDAPSGQLAGVAEAVGSAGNDAQGIKFSHVTIVQEPGGKSHGVSGAFAANIDGGGDDATTRGPLPGRSGVRRIVQEPGGNSSAVSRILSHDSADGVDKAQRAGPIAEDSREREHDNNDGEHVSRATVRESGQSAVGGSLAVGADAPMAVGKVGGDTESRSGTRTALIDPPTFGDRTDPNAADSRPETVKGGAIAAKPDPEGAKAKRPNDSWSLFLEAPDKGIGALDLGTDGDAPLPLEVIVRRCVREPVLAQCSAVDSAALAFLVRDAGVTEHLASLRTFLLGLTSDFLHDFTLRLLDGLYDGGVDWRRSSNLDAAFAASALATGLDSVPLAETFRYEVDPTCGGILGSGPATGSLDLGRTADPSGMTGSAAHSATAAVTTPTTTRAELSLSSSLSVQEEELYSPVALSFVSPVLEVKWPVGVLLPTGVLHTYGSIHRSLIRHQLVLHRLRRLRLVLRELDACLDAASGGGIGGVGGAGRRSGRRQRGGARVSWDRGRLHWLHLFRHEMQHMADSLQTYFVEQAEAGWPNLRRSLAVAGGGAARGGGGGLAALVAAHSRYITKMQRYMFLGTDRQGAVARGSIQEFYAVICTVGRVTDGLLSSKPSRFPPALVEDVIDGTCTGSAVGEMVLPDEAFAELAAVREKFDAARRGLCAALSEICAAGGGTRARPLLSVIGYGGYGGDDFFVAADLSR